MVKSEQNSIYENDKQRCQTSLPCDLYLFFGLGEYVGVSGTRTRPRPLQVRDLPQGYETPRIRYSNSGLSLLHPCQERKQKTYWFNSIKLLRLCRRRCRVSSIKFNRMTWSLGNSALFVTRRLKVLAFEGPLLTWCCFLQQ